MSVYVPEFERSPYLASMRAVYADGSEIHQWDVDGKFTATLPDLKVWSHDMTIFDTPEAAALALRDAGFGPANQGEKR